MIIPTVSSSTPLALVAYGFLTIIPNKCSAQIDTTLHLGGRPYRVAGLAITIPSQPRDGGALPEAKAESVAVFPCMSKSVLLSYSPLTDTEFYHDEDPSIAAVCVDHERIWVGFRFYSGEGVRGVGGLGFYDLGTHQSGLLRHPALIDYSVVDLMATNDTIYAKTMDWGEGEELYGNGVGSSPFLCVKS